MRRLLSVAGWMTVLMLVVTIGVASAETETKAEAPGFRVEQADINLGTIAAGSDAVVTYIFHNDTDKDGKIIKAKPA